MIDAAPIFAARKELLRVGSEARRALLDRHEWVFHDTAFEAMQDIRSTELEIRDPGVIDPELLKLIDGELGRQARRVVCLKPAASVVRGSSFGCQVRFALCRNNVPEELGVDWSNDRAALAVNRLSRDLSLGDSFVKVVEEAGSFVSYSAVQAGLLRVCPAGVALDSNPAGWPKLVCVEDDSIVARF